MNWKSVFGYEGYYEVSECGKIRRVAGGRGAVINRAISTKRKNAKGYELAELCVGDEKCRLFVHRIVCTAFHGQCPSSGHCVNHKDGNKRNNHASNLEWVTIKENNVHAWSLGLNRAIRGESNGRAKLTLGQVQQIRTLRGLEGQRKIAGRFGVSRSLVQRIHQSKVWSYTEWPEDLRGQQWPKGRN